MSVEKKTQIFSTKMVCLNCKKGFRPNPKAPRSKLKFCTIECRQASYHRRRTELARTEWHSPIEVVEAARAVMGGIDLDPASCAQANEIVKAEKFYSVREDGLRQPWFGRVWLNPPYGRFGPAFIKRFVELFSTGSIEQGVLLLGTHHLTSKWMVLLFSHKPIVCLPVDRLQFSDRSRPAHGSVILGIGVDSHQFTKIFSQFGQLLTLIDTP